MSAIDQPREKRGTEKPRQAEALHVSTVRGSDEANHHELGRTKTPERLESGGGGETLLD